MPRQKSPLEASAGKLILAIQREWGSEAGEPRAEISEQVMHEAHALLQAAKLGSLAGVLGTGSVADFLGRDWVMAHPAVRPWIEALEAQVIGERPTTTTRSS